MLIERNGNLCKMHILFMNLKNVVSVSTIKVCCSDFQFVFLFFLFIIRIKLCKKFCGINICVSVCVYAKCVYVYRGVCVLSLHLAN